MSNADFFAAARLWAGASYPGLAVEAVTITLTGMGKVKLPVPQAAAAAAAWGRPAGPAEGTTEWVPSDAQLAILDALEGRALKTELLVSKSGVERRQLFREMAELRDRGLVVSTKLGYVAVDTPPEDIGFKPPPPPSK